MDVIGQNEILISYHQFTVYQHGMKRPHFDWLESALEKGYVADQYAAAFAAETSSKALIEVRVSSSGQEPECTIQIPFHVKDTGIEVSSVMSEKLTCELSSGDYMLCMNAISLGKQEDTGEHKMKYELTFIPSEKPA
ncbi:DNA-entry nuclease [Metabacillus sp. KIGAM252]|uniref:DNA-entry nuclease n=1 Tax=Metabacillus flavus TaxID=2823519 RepID=A0ABS5LCY2_9BACI|nr:competence protein ComJ [Metabacillus flavus]MBS2968595.1 DNA-entry nuclease [Metabacillus flavus]